ncbi:ATP-dependent helicase [Schlesneria paludicola]|uniref:ATP-dependent helicase n=1 Tax=Schlesneria paludicola TaxID=360056 RepID=UPI00029A7FCC|nr:UvrD-helicase domain-containing protein [Schlesneria paludicola]
MSSTPYSPFLSTPASKPGFTPPPKPSGAAGGGQRPGGASLDELNPSQRDAAKTLDGPLLVLAGAGTGKTRVITFRMAEMIRSGIDPNRILSVTFTNKAAKEMAERMSHFLGRRPSSRPVISTFHSLCVRILREEIEALGYPSKFVIYDRGDQESAARKALRDIKVTDAALKPADLLGQISRWKMVGVLPELAAEYADDDKGFLASSGYRRYQQSLRASGAVDFDDLLLLTAQLFDQFPDVLARQQKKFEKVQIDEYQDTNEMQFQIIGSLVKPHRNLCVVGDDDQSIYGWRGAEVKHILSFQQHFPEAKVVRLQDNYRCTGEIIRLANQLVKHNRGRHDKTLVAHKDGPTPCVKPYADEQTEAEGVVREINYLVKELKVPPQDIAILFRTNEQPRLFETELRRVRVPYQLVGGQSFFDRKEVRDVMAYLKVLSNPQDEVSLLRIINTPQRGIGDASTSKLLNRAVKSGRKIWDVIPDALAEKEITQKTAKAIEQFRHLMVGYHQRFNASGARLGETLQQLLHEIDYESEIEKQYKAADQQLARSAVLDECISALREYEQKSAKPSLTEFLDQTSLNGNDRSFGEDDSFEQSAVKLMTLHSAKGLEFPRVYLVGLEEGLLPHKRSITDELENNPAAIEEERRLAYVGITRAKDVLTISYAQTRMKWGKRSTTKPSRFLVEMQRAIRE